MKIVLKNDSDKPVYATFENGPDWNMNSKSEVDMKIEDGAEIKFGAGKIETKNIKRPR